MDNNYFGLSDQHGIVFVAAATTIINKLLGRLIIILFKQQTINLPL